MTKDMVKLAETISKAIAPMGFHLAKWDGQSVFRLVDRDAYYCVIEAAPKGAK